MDYYNPNLFHKISIEELLLELKNNRLINEGSISVWGDEIGKPGDSIYTLKNIAFDGQNSKLTLLFGTNCVIEIQDPEEITLNEKIVCIKNATKVLWNTNNMSLNYDRKNNQLFGTANNGPHTFRIQSEKPAFLFYTW